jgi:hypothetical protein
VGKHLSEKQGVFLNDHDKVLRDFTEHQQELYFKIEAIMDERATMHCSAISTVDREAIAAPKNDETIPPPTSAMEGLVKETTTLHKVLSKYLSSETLKMVFKSVFRSYQAHLEKELQGMRLFSVNAKNSVLIDIQYFIHKLNALEGVEGPGSDLEVVVNNMKILDKSLYVPPPPSESQAGSRSTTPQPQGQNGAGVSIPTFSTGMFSGGDGSSNAHKDNSQTNSTSIFSSSRPGFNFKNLMNSGKPASSTSSSPGNTLLNNMNSTTGSLGSGHLPSAPGGHGGNVSTTGPNAGSSSASHAQAIPTPGTAAMVDAANKTKQIASDWMKKMAFMKAPES